MPTPETLINATAENNQQEQALLLTEDEGNDLETSSGLNDASSTSSTERVMLQLQLMKENNLKGAKKFLEIFKSQSES